MAKSNSEIERMLGDAAKRQTEVNKAAQRALAVTTLPEQQAEKPTINDVSSTRSFSTQAER